jgi:hypothetical protein
MASRLAPASEVAGSEDIQYHFKIGRPRPFLNDKVCPPAASEVAGGHTIQF